MNRIRMLSTLVALAVLAALVIVTTTSKRTVRDVYASSGCSLGTLTGSYGFTGTGFFSFPSTGGGGYAPTVDVGVVKFDGAGNVTDNFTDSTNGRITTGLSASGTYTVNSDCTGTVTFVNFPSPGENSPFTTVILGGGTELMAISTHNDQTSTVRAKKQ